MHEQAEKHRGIRPLPGLDFRSGLIQRISYVNGLIKAQEDAIRQADPKTDIKYERYLIGIFSEEKGALLTEGLIYQADPRNPQLFTIYESTSKNDSGKKPSQEYIHFRFNVPGSRRKVYKTQIVPQMLRIPGPINSPEDLTVLLQHQRPSLSTEQLQDIGAALEALTLQIRDAERAGNYVLGGELKERKRFLLAETVSSARRSFLTHDSDVKVVLHHGKTPKSDSLSIHIDAGDRQFHENMKLPKDPEEREKLMEKFGTPDRIRPFKP